MPDSVEIAISVVFAWTALVALSVAVPQTVLLVRLVRAGNAIAPYTLKTVAWTGTLGVILLWRSMLFLDYSLFEQRYLGTIDDRWPWDFALAVVFALAVNYAAFLYHWTVTLGRGRRGTTGPPRPPRRARS